MYFLLRCRNTWTRPEGVNPWVGYPGGPIVGFEPTFLGTYWEWTRATETRRRLPLKDPTCTCKVAKTMAFRVLDPLFFGIMAIVLGTVEVQVWEFGSA